MKKLQKLTIILLSCLLSNFCLKAMPKIDYVNPMVGTDFNGHTFPGATVPFGMIQLSPDTRMDTWHGCSGYHYSDSVIIGFSHTHLSGTGCQDYGDVLFMPVVNYTDKNISRNTYSSVFSHNQEKATPGYYEVTLKNGNIKASFTTGLRSGIHKYEYAKSDVAQLVIDLEHRDELLAHDFIQIDNKTIKGHRRSAAWAREQDVYFHTEFSRPIKNIRFNKEKTKAVITFENTKKENIVLAKIAISSVSTENAALNLKADQPGKKINFDKALAKAEKMWEDFLNKIDVTSDNQENLKVFYTAMYHTAIAPNVYSDVNGEYRGMDRKVHKSENGRTQYTVFSIWDTFRALHPLFTIIEPEKTEDFLYSMYCIYAECGKLPIWELSRCETNCMIGYNSVSVISDAIIKGVAHLPLEGEGFTAASLLDAMVVSANKKEFGIDVMREYGVVLADKEHESVSKTLEYAYDDWCIAQLADYLYKKTENGKYLNLREEYLKYALNYRNIFDPTTGFMRARLNGRWLSPFHPSEVNNHYTEANSWQYSFFVPQDIEGHIALLGGDEAFCAKIDALYSAPEQTKGRTQVDISGLIGQYAHGNEPSHHIAFLYPYAGKAWKTQEMTRKILFSQYTSKADGLCGNDDCGQMSAWYVLGALGIYNVSPGSVDYILSTPIFKEAKINLENGKTFSVKTSDETLTYTQGITYTDSKKNTSNYTRSYITHDMIVSGGTLDFATSTEPNKEFAISEGDRPHNEILTQAAIDFIVNPWFEMESDVFKDSLQISIFSADSSSKIYYRILSHENDTESNKEYKLYKAPFFVYENSFLQTYTSKGDKRSYLTESMVYKINNDYSINTLVPYNPQYDAGGENGLINGVRGHSNWKAGGWQGFQACDFESIVTLDTPKTIKSLGAGFLQDIRSWIWMPTKVEFYTSMDGENFNLAGTVENKVDPKDYTIQTQDLVLNLEEAIEAKYVKVIAYNFGIIPSWHLGAGGKTFIFIDEILISEK